jgi:hypothetical protein
MIMSSSLKKRLAPGIHDRGLFICHATGMATRRPFDPGARRFSPSDFP